MSLLQSAVTAWGTRQLAALDAEDRLSVACEKGYSEDPVTLKLREAYQVGWVGIGVGGSGVE